MEKRIERLVELLFDDIPYSEEVSQAQDKIRASLNTEFEKLSATMSKDTAFEELLKQYGRLSDMAVLAGYTAETAEKWRECGEAKQLKPLKKELGKLRRRIYGISILTVGAFAELLWLIYYLAVSPSKAIFIVLFIALLMCGAFAVYRSFKRLEKEYKADKFDTEAYMYLRALSDRYTKRLFNSIAIFFAVITVFILSEMSFYFFGNSKSSELVENFFSNIFFIEIPIYLCLKNMLCLHMVHLKINISDTKRLKKHLIGVTTFSAAYWLIVFIIALITSSSIKYPANTFIAAGVVFAVLILVYNLTSRKKITYKNIVINKPRIAVWTAVIVLLSGYSYLQKETWYTQPYINSVAVVEHNESKIDYDEETGVYKITSTADDFKILHLTDIHLGGSLYSYLKDMKALQACYAEIEYTCPDLVIVTGDLTFPMGIMSLSLNNSAPVEQFAAFMRNTGIPWAFTYGNHDTESLATTSKQDLNELYMSLSYKTSGNLLYPYTQPDITGRNNQLIEVYNNDGSLRQALFLIDSNAYTGEGVNAYDYIHDDQVEWYAGEVERLNTQEEHTVGSMVFFHIPLQQYRTAYELYEQGSDEVTYFFGENGEKMIDKVCCSDHPSSLFDRMLELGSTDAVLCGHDHYNNMSLEYKGIRLTYGMSIDYLAMPGIEDDTAQRGAELITIHSDGSWELEQIPLHML